MRFSRRPTASPSRRAPPNLVVGNDAWKTFVADAMATRPSTRTARQKSAIEEALRGEDDLPEDLREMPARLAALESRIEAGGDGVICRLTARDWHLYVMESPRQSDIVAARLNAAVEEAVAEGEEIEVLVDRIRRDHPEVGAMSEPVKAVMRHVAETVQALRAAPAP